MIVWKDYKFMSICKLTDDRVRFLEENEEGILASLGVEVMVAVVVLLLLLLFSLEAEAVCCQ